MSQLLILDKDGTLVIPASGKQFVQHPEDQIVLPGVKDAIAHYHAQNYICVIASNQGGVAAGYKSLEAAIAEMCYCLQLLPQIESVYFCPDFKGNECWCVRRDRSFQVGVLKLKGRMRKPGDGMIQQALWAHPGVTDILVVGDRPEDEQAAIAAKARFTHAQVFRGLFAKG